MSKKIHEFNNIIRKLRKDLFGKGPERIETVFVEDMAVSKLYGNLTPTEQFIASSEQGHDMIHIARTQMVQKIYKEATPTGLEEIVDAKLLHLFTDIKIEEDMAISVFQFDRNIEEE
ncbi:MAG TPA: DUF2294 domain-containing protein [Bacillota bacterium]|nr:DUF2294 domain-containing protein [Bacillota bacterium]